MVNKCKCNSPKCGHQWQPIVQDPVVCPRCKSYNWREIKDERKEQTNEGKHKSK